MFLSAKFIQNAIFLALAKVILKYEPDNTTLKNLIKSKNYDKLKEYFLSDVGRNKIKELRERVPDFDKEVIKEISKFYLIATVVVGKFMSHLIGGVLVGLVMFLTAKLIKGKIKAAKFEKIENCLVNGIGVGLIESVYSYAIVYDYEKNVAPILEELGLKDIGLHVKRSIMKNAYVLNTISIMSNKYQKYEPVDAKSELAKSFRKELVKTIKAAAKKLDMKDDEINQLVDYIIALRNDLEYQVNEFSTKMKVLLVKVVKADPSIRKKIEKIADKYDAENAENVENIENRIYLKRIFITIALTLFYSVLDLILPKLLDKFTNNNTSPFVKAVLHGLYPLIKNSLTQCVVK